MKTVLFPENDGLVSKVMVPVTTIYYVNFRRQTVRIEYVNNLDNLLPKKKKKTSKKKSKRLA